MQNQTRQRTTIGAGVALVIGSVMPWGTIRSGFGQISVSGIEGDGVFTLIFGALIVALAFRLGDRGARIAAPGMGLYLTVAAAAVAFVMPLMSVDREHVAVTHC